MQQFSYYTIEPTPELAPYVRAFWVFEGNGRHGKPYIYRSMADACAELVFHYKAAWDGISEEDELIAGTNKLTTLQSPCDKYQRFLTNGDFGIFGVYLYPDAIPALFGLSSAEMRNEMASLAECLGHQGKIVEEQILTAMSNRDRVRLLSDFLLRLSRQARPPDPSMQHCIRYLLHRPTQLKVEEIADKFNLSARQLERKFKTITGFGPKAFSRISRFQQALRRYGTTYKNLTDLAYECGYYDQSHFIHEFKRYSGYEPRSYFSGKAEGIDYRDVD